LATGAGRQTPTKVAAVALSRHGTIDTGREDPEGGIMWSPNALLIVEEAVMPRIGLRELKTHASEVLRDVEENEVRYVITNRNKPMAIIIPYTSREATEPKSGDEAWEAFFAAGEQVRQAWKSPLTAVEILREMRR
jgi:prevent-host-death family protein